MRGEEEEDEEEDEEEEEDEDEEEVRDMVPEEAWAAARPSRNRELQVTIMATIIIIMVIILAHLEQTPSPFKSPLWKLVLEVNLLWFQVDYGLFFRFQLAVMPKSTFLLTGLGSGSAQLCKPKTDSPSRCLF